MQRRDKHRLIKATPTEMNQAEPSLAPLSVNAASQKNTNIPQFHSQEPPGCPNLWMLKCLMYNGGDMFAYNLRTSPCYVYFIYCGFLRQGLM